MRRIWNDKRFWAAVTLAIVLGLGVAGVRIPPAIMSAIQAVIAALPEGAIGEGDDVDDGDDGDDGLSPTPKPSPPAPLPPDGRGEAEGRGEDSTTSTEGAP